MKYGKYQAADDKKIKDGKYQAADPPQLCSAHGQALSSSGGIASCRKHNDFKSLYGRL